MPKETLESLIGRLKEIGVLKTPIIEDAFKNVDRAKFVPEEMKPFVYIDEALSIGSGQTISQPYTVAFMLELLEPKPGDKIIDIGSGSGWQAAILAHIVSSGGAEGRVFGIEVVPELCKYGKKNVSQFNFMEKGFIKWLCGDASKKETFEPVMGDIGEGVDKIIVAAALAGDIRVPTSDSLPPAWKSMQKIGSASDSLPQPWKDMLKTGGKIVVPIRESIWLFVKKDKDNFEAKEFPGFVFVPFVAK